MSPLQVAQLSPMKRDAHPQSLSYITFRASSKGAPPPHLQVPLTAPIERERYSTASRVLLQ